MTKKVKTPVRGAGGRFEARVGDRLVAKESETVDPLDLDLDDASEPKAESLVSNLINNSRELFNTALNLQETLHSIGVLETNQISAHLGCEDISDGTDEEVEHESEMHLIQMVERYIAHRSQNVLYSTAGKVLCYHAIPAMALAAYVTTHLTGVDRSSLFEYLDRASGSSNENIHQFVVDLRNTILSGITAQEGVLLTEDVSEDSPYVAQAVSPLLAYLTVVNDLMVEVSDHIHNLNSNIQRQLM